MSFEEIVENAKKCIKTRQQIGAELSPRFLAFTAPSSICSEKVRSTLAIKSIPYIHYSVDLFMLENYQPAYVQMRSLGWKGGALIGDGELEWTGSTSAAKFGFDPHVVPTLVDMKENRVVVDSAIIVKYIEDAVPNPSLYDDAYTDLIQKHISLVDDTPHAGLLYGGDPDKDFLPPVLKAPIFGIHELQEKSLEKWLDDKNLPNSLRHFYEAKLKKCNNVGQVVTQDPDKLRQQIINIRMILSELDKDLANSTGPWLCNDVFTMADLVWHVSLLRLLTFGCYYLTESMPRIEAYKDRLLSHPILKSATYTWPGFIPSPHLTKLLQKEGSFALVERNRAIIVLMGFEGGLFLGLKELLKYALAGWHATISLGIGAAILAHQYSG